MKSKLLLIGAGLCAAIAYAFYKTSRFGAEMVRYEVQRKDGRFEVRRYPGVAVARTAMRNHGEDDSFRRLFDFISGANVRNEHIAMTTPVLLEGEPGAPGTMSFLMPETTEQRGIPHPRAGGIELAQRPEAKVAVLRFRGGMREKRERRAIAELRAWMRDHFLESEGEPIIAYYDAPFIPGPLRRNEAMLRIAR